LQKGNPESGLFSVKAKATLHFFSKKLGNFLSFLLKTIFFFKKIEQLPLKYSRKLSNQQLFKLAL